MKLTAPLCVLVGALSLPAMAHADLLSLWVAGKGGYMGGSGEVFKTFGDQGGGGVELGVHVLFLDIWADLYAMPDSQMFISANVGPSWSFGSDLKLGLGLYASGLLFVFPENDAGGQQLQLSPEQRQEFPSEQLVSIETAYGENAGQTQDLERTGFGLAARVRATVEYSLLPLLSIGVEGIAGYHYMLSGEEAAAGARNKAIEKTAADQNLTSEQTDILRDATGAKAVDSDSLYGMHYQVGAYLKLTLGL